MHDFSIIYYLKRSGKETIKKSHTQLGTFIFDKLRINKNLKDKIIKLKKDKNNWNKTFILPKICKYKYFLNLNI